MDIQDNIRNLVASAKLEQALDEFIKWAGDNDNDINNSLILIKGQHAALKRQENLGLLSFSDASRDRARISNSVLELVNQIKDNGKAKPAAAPSAPQPSGAVISGEGGDDVKTTGTILFLASNPSDTGKLQLDKEFVRVFKSLKEGEELYRLETEFAVTPSALQSAVLKYRPRIIHFSGHGTGRAGEGGRVIARAEQEPDGIILQDANGKSKLVSGAALANLFGLCLKKFQIDVVVLNACHSEEQAKAIAAAGIPYVVGMNKAVNDDTAIEFSTGFYRGIATEGDIEFAFDLAKNAVMLEGLSGDDIPVLIKK